jgi:hypothetical protein
MKPEAAVPTTGAAWTDVHVGLFFSRAACFDTSAIGKSTSTKRLQVLGIIFETLFYRKRRVNHHLPQG